ncbi:PrgI family mobile element protein [Desulfofalx alkaliphila]|uniref:PrgI family mobile element protein n=1 Tax=Desulfofalx alkaliphila TaxID=105483 RepID=UPI0004E13869|nr:PrgI family protein [Desulfofalx alkaliphila]
MRMFSIPMELEGEERTFGGVATIRQVVYVVATLIVTVSVHFLLKLLAVSMVINIFICTPLLMLGMCLAFIKIHEIKLDKYILLLVRYHLRSRAFILKGDD